MKRKIAQGENPFLSGRPVRGGRKGVARPTIRSSQIRVLWVGKCAPTGRPTFVCLTQGFRPGCVSDLERTFFSEVLSDKDLCNGRTICRSRSQHAAAVTSGHARLDTGR